MPGNAIHLNVLTMVADMMTKELGLKSGYWFLPPYFATYALGLTKTNPKYVAVEFNNIFTGKINCLKRVFIPVCEYLEDGHDHWYLVVVDRLAGEFILLDPLPTEKQFKRKRNARELAIYLEKMLEDRYYYEFETTPNFTTEDFLFKKTECLLKIDIESNDSGLWVASWMIGCYDDDDFDIKVDDGSRMKIAVSLVLKNHNIINQTIKNKAIENLEQQDEDHDFCCNYAYQS
ncbi:hypothetical protein PIB30_057502 [Stylosanthes scabra]|uniref:Ubiquitin-like protease family profile domain-containing protein n=1 Tax=Stylosanthes scabra TaxID=79078 RepID=A0ABU6YJX9_9FABA|nr:hypothetical protein [Stylosanthes scabra]